MSLDNRNSTKALYLDFYPSCSHRHTYTLMMLAPVYSIIRWSVLHLLSHIKYRKMMENP